MDKWKVVVIVLLATFAVSFGETLLSKGMKLSNVPDGAGWLGQARALLNRYVLCGTLLMMLYFGFYMLALKFADLSFVLPITAVSYLLGATFARLYLHEHVSPARWLGAVIITVGVIVVGLGEAGSRR